MEGDAAEAVTIVEPFSDEYEGAHQQLDVEDYTASQATVTAEPPSAEEFTASPLSEPVMGPLVNEGEELQHEEPIATEIMKRLSISELLNRASFSAGQTTTGSSSELGERLDKVNDMAKQQQDRAEQPVQMNRAARILEAMGRAANVKQERAEREQVEEEAKKQKKKHSWAAARKASVTATALAEAADEAKTRRGWLASALGGRRRGNASEGKNKYTNINVGVHIDLAKRKLSDAVDDDRHADAAEISRKIAQMEESIDETEEHASNEAEGALANSSHMRSPTNTSYLNLNLFRSRTSPISTS